MFEQNSKIDFLTFKKSGNYKFVTTFLFLFRKYLHLTSMKNIYLTCIISFFILLYTSIEYIKRFFLRTTPLLNTFIHKRTQKDRKVFPHGLIS